MQCLPKLVVDHLAATGEWMAVDGVSIDPPFELRGADDAGDN
jgi:hypothetical protein